MHKIPLCSLKRSLLGPCCAALAVAFFQLTAAPAAAIVMRLEPTTATVGGAGDTARFCVELGGEGVTIAGTQNDIVWNGDCATLIRCQASPAAGKPLSANIRPNSYFTLTAIMLSLGDLDPIPDGSLYCCDFRVETAEPGSCCPLSLQRARVSDPQARGADARTMGAQICVADSAPAGGAGARRGAPGPVGGIVAGPGSQPETGAGAGESSGGAVVGGLRRPVPTPDLPPIGGVASVGSQDAEVAQPEVAAAAPAGPRGASASSLAPAEQERSPAGSPSARAVPSVAGSPSPAAAGTASPAAPATAVVKSPAVTATVKAPPTRVPTKRAAAQPAPTPEEGWGCAIAAPGTAGRAPLGLLCVGLAVFALGRRR